MVSSFGVRKSFLAVLLGITLVTFANAQKKGEQPQIPDDVIRINTELIQSPVIVLDKQGKFITGLTRDQFELTINNRPQAVAFFDEVIAGTPVEAQKIEAARSTAASTGSAPAIPVGPFYGRTIVFFLDDYHLSSESVNRARSAILKFIDNSLGQNDRALIISASGQIGFLQQLTDNKDVLRAAINRLKHRDTVTNDDQKPPMTAYQAYTIMNGDSGTLQYFADIAVKDNFTKLQANMPQPTAGRAVAEADRRGEQSRRQAEYFVKNRAQNLLVRYGALSNSSLVTLKQTVASLNQMPGSKLVFFISDGFFLNQQVSGEIQKLNDITSGAVRAGSVVYAIQSSGLNTTMTDAKAEVRLGPNANMGAPMIGQDSAFQAPLYTVAADTGGRALFNSNSFEGSIQQALNETSQYYLLAWRPETDAKRSDVFHKVGVRVKDHPEWTVRVQKGYFLAAEGKKPAEQPPTKTVSAVVPDPAAQRAEKMRETLSALYPIRVLPVLVSLSYLDQPATGAVLEIGTQLSLAPFVKLSDAEKQAMVVELAGVVLNDEGTTVSSFSGQLKFDMNSSGTTRDSTVSHVDEIRVKPGLYQVRVAAREDKSGLAGSTNEWILVPDLSGKKLSLSSILMGDANAPQVKTSTDQKTHLSIDHRFTREGKLRFMTYVYNAAPGADGKPDVTLQLRVMRDDKVISTSPQIKLALDGVEDLARIPYGAQIPLSKLAAGRYQLSVAATDNLTRTTAMQSVKFVVE